MTLRETGNLLRLLGPLLQVACLIPLLSRGPGPVGVWDYVWLGGFLAGFVLVLGGIGLSAWNRRPPRSKAEPPAWDEDSEERTEDA